MKNTKKPLFSPLLTPSDLLHDSDFQKTVSPVFTRGVRPRVEESEILEDLKPAKYLEDCFPELPMLDSTLDGEPLHHFERLDVFKARHPFFEDRSVKVSFLSARCPTWLKDDFDFICRTVEGEDPAVVLRRLAREYVRHNIPQ